MKKCFNIPGFNDHLTLNLFLLDNYVSNREMFYDDVEISSVFGNFHFCVWDGGRNFFRYTQCTKEEIEYVRDAYASREIPIRFIFTNPAIKEEHLDDRFGNLVLTLCEHERNEIVVNSPLMENYIRENYPKYKIISSTTKRILGHDAFLEELNKDYYQVCLDYDLNHDMELLNKIPMELRGKCEFLSNAICPPGCKWRKFHYNATGLSQLSYLRDTYDLQGRCQIFHSSCHPSVLGQGNNLSLEDIEKYSKMGYKYFKLEGRTLPSSTMVAQYMYYLIKPEWHYAFLSAAAETPGIFVNDKNSDLVGDLYQPKGYLVTPDKKESPGVVIS